MQKKNL